MWRVATAVIVGIAIGVLVGIVGSAVLVSDDATGNRTRVRSFVIGEVTAIKEKAQRYVDGRSSAEELKASTPIVSSVASELGLLSELEVVGFRRAVTLDMEMRREGSKEKAKAAIVACDDVLSILKAPQRHGSRFSTTLGSSPGLIGAMIGGLIGVIGSVVTTLLVFLARSQQHTKTVRALAVAEVIAIKEKGERFLEGRSGQEELSASTPIMPRDIGVLTQQEAVAVRRAVVLDMEMRKEASGRPKVEETVQACADALEVLTQHERFA